MKGIVIIILEVTSINVSIITLAIIHLVESKTAKICCTVLTEVQTDVIGVNMINVNVLREGNVQRSLLKTIRKRQMEFLGHVCRRRGLEFLSLTGKVEGKRDRGKQRITFLDSLCNSATGGQSKGLNFLKLSDDRDVWRGMVANVCSRSGT